MIPDHALQQTASGEDFSTLFAAAYGRLWSLAHALTGSRSDADDLVQDAAIVGLEKFHAYKSGSNFTAWMAQIVRFHAKNQRAKRARRRTEPVDPVDIDQAHGAGPLSTNPTIAQAAAGDASPLHDAFDDEVARAIQELDETPRACLLLKVIHELSYEEIGEILEIPQGTAMSHVHRSRTRIRDRVTRAGQESSTR